MPSQAVHIRPVDVKTYESIGKREGLTRVLHGTTIGGDVDLDHQMQSKTAMIAAQRESQSGDKSQRNE